MCFFHDLAEEEYICSFLACKMSIGYNIFYEALSPDRSHEEKDNIVQQLFADYKTTLSKDPMSSPTKSHLMVIKKII